MILLSSIATYTSICSGATLRLDNTSGGLGEALDLLVFTSGDPATTTAVPELNGLFITVHGITSDGNLNATATALGINGTSDTNTSRFEAAFSQSVTFSFSQDVSISQLDFTSFENGDTFDFAGTSIANTDLTNGSTDIYDFSSPLEITANTQFTLQATAGDIGIEAMTLTVIPEPSSTALIALGTLALMLKRR